MAPHSPPGDATFRNVLAVTGPELFWGFGSALTIEGPMPAAFAKHLGAGQGFLGAWFLVGSGALAIAMVVTGWYVPSLAKKRGLVAWGHLVTGAMYLPIGLLARWAGPWGGDAPQAAALAGFGLFMLALGFLMPAWLALIGELFREGQRGRVLGLVFVVNRVGGVLGGLAAERLLRLSWNGTDTWTLLWALAAAASALGALPLLAVVEPDVERHPRRPFPAYVRGMFQSLSDLPALKRFIAVDLLAAAGWVTVGFYGDAALRGQDLDSHWSGVWSAVAAAAQLAGALVMTWWGAKISPQRGLAAGAACAALASVLAGSVSGPYPFMVVAALVGCFMVARQTCQAPQVMALARGREPTLPLALSMSATASFQALLPLGVGLLLPIVGYQPVFLAVAVLAAAAAGLLLRLAPPAPPAPSPGA